MHKLEEILEWGGSKKKIAFLAVSAAALVISMLEPVQLPFSLAWIAIVLCGIPIVLEATMGLITAFDIKADVLVSIALIASVITGEIFAAGEVAFIMQLGALLEELTVARARAGIEKLVHLTPRTARRLSGTAEQIIPASEVKVGDILRVLPGETIPVDGVIRSGSTSVNQAVMTGESLPVDKSAGDSVSSGTVNQFGSFDMEAVRVGEDSLVQRMIRLVQSADADRARIVGIADRWATWIVITAVSAAVLTWLVTGEMVRAVTILVVFCPCALVLATPTAIMAAIGNAARHGVLVKEGDALERLSAVRKIIFDKTGTLTHGTPRVAAVQSFLPDVSGEEIYAYAAGAEARSEHPLGKAVVSCYRASHTVEAIPARSFKMLPGLGIWADCDGKEVIAGNESLLCRQQIPIGEKEISAVRDYTEEGCTIIYISIDQRLAGFIALSDTLRKDAGDMIAGVKAAGIRPVLLTGDHEKAAKNIAEQLHMDEVYANCLPEDKLKWVDTDQDDRKQVCMIGDGINDAPALKKAFVGIAMGGIGSDIAVDAADIVLVKDDIKELVHLLSLSRRMMVTIRYNIVFSMSLNFAAVFLAMTGSLNPVLGALVHNAGSVIVIANSALLLKWRKRRHSLGF